MATRYRIAALSPEDQQTLKDLTGYAHQAGVSPDQILDAFEQGQIPDYILKSIGVPESRQPAGNEAILKGSDWDNFLKSGSGKLFKRLQGIVSRLPSLDEAKKSYLKTNLEDTPNLTDQQLAEKQGILTDLSNEKVSSTTPSLVDYFTRQLQAKFKQFGSGVDRVPLEAIKDIAQYAVNALNQGNYDPQNVVNRIVSTTGEGRNGSGIDNARTLANDIPKDYTREIQSGQYTPVASKADYSLDQKAVGDIIADRAKVRDLTKQFEDFKNTAPGQLAAEREAFAASQKLRAKDFITGEYAPQVAERLAAIGLGDSGQVASSIGSKYADLIGDIDDATLQQLNDDKAFFGGQGYQKMFADLIAARADLSGTIGTEREKLRGEQYRGFARREADITSKFNLDLFRQQSQAAYNNYQKQVTKQREVSRQQQNAATIGEAARAGGQIAVASFL